MNSLIKGFGLGVITLLVVLILSCVVTKSNRQNEVDESLNTAIHQTMKVVEDNRYKISSNEELLAEFNRNLVSQFTSNSNVDVIVYDVDYAKGILDIEIEMTFKYPHGTSDKVSSRKTVIIDDVEISN